MGTMSLGKSDSLYESASRYLVAGVSGAARVNAVLGRPVFITHGDGSRLYDVEGRDLIDYNISHGASSLGHNHPKIRQAVEKALSMGVICSYETEYQGRLAEMICQTIPCAEQVRFANGGSEATMATIRLARAVTGRQKILKFEGHFHGLYDYVMWNGGGPARDEFPTYPYVPLSVDSGGVPPQIADLVIVIPWNDPVALEQAMREHGEEIAAVICEPVSYNAGCLMPKPGFMRVLREQATRNGAVLIFDEILSGFRMAPGGAQEYYSVTPDVSAFGKAISGGVPIAVIAGKREFMQQFSPLGPAVHSGTYSGHLFAVLAALATLEEVRREGFYEEVFAKAKRLYGGLDSLFAQHGVPARVQGLGSCFSMHFGVDGEIWEYQDAARGDFARYRKFIRACLERGIYFQTYGANLGGVDHHQFSAAHTMADIDETLNRVESALHDLKWN